MKKLISVFLCTVVFTVNAIFTPYATTVYAADTVVDIVKSISLDNVVKMVKSLYKVGYNVATTGSGDGAASSKALDSIWGEDSAVNKWLQTKLFPFMDSSGNIDLTNPDSPITYDKEKQLVEFNPTFTTELNQQLQDSVHALDGYYYFEPKNPVVTACIPVIRSNYREIYKDDAKALLYINSTKFTEYMEELLNYRLRVFIPLFAYDGSIASKYVYFIDQWFKGKDMYLYINHNGQLKLHESKNLYHGYDKNVTLKYLKVRDGGTGVDSPDGPESDVALDYIKASMSCAYGESFKVFYSQEDLDNFLNNNQQRIFVPQLPSGGFKINIKYVNNTTNLPDITYNITTENKTETEIQNQFDTTFNNYLNDLNDFTDGGGGSTITPTPTPSGGGSGGDFGDGTTPTPKPDFTDGSLIDTNTLLQKILDKLTEFSANHDKLAKTITDYIEKNNGKLEEILIAIQALSDGKTETEQNGCKYDFTALSEYLTKLWNDSDKKFDEMVKLLEENNKYQQKLVDSLNEIKALLIADTVMNFFKDRSQETAEKAKDKFPTSIPWDISLVLNSMSAEPKNPKFSLPIKIESFKINETIDIDLSTEEWEKLAKTCRYILSVTFILFLIHLSRKLFSNGGDD